MEELPRDIVNTIEEIQHCKAADLLARYADWLPENTPCRRSEVLRLEIIYRIQAAYYGMEISPVSARMLEGLMEERLLIGRRRRHLPSGTRLVREWKGASHEVEVLGCGRFAYGGDVYPSLDAVACAVTGTKSADGRAFFMVERFLREEGGHV